MSAHLSSIEHLIEEFKQMPGIGRKAAERLGWRPQDDLDSLEEWKWG